MTTRYSNRNPEGVEVEPAEITVAQLREQRLELLEALKDAEIIYAEYMALGPKGYSQSFELVTRTIGSIRAAIAKAEGR